MTADREIPVSPEPERRPSEEDRRRAACRAMALAPGLVRYAARFTSSLHDAEDAYQRAMEIALTRAPVTEEPRFMAWLHTVLKHEALAVARARRREAPGCEADVAVTAAEDIAAPVGPEATAEWRERYRAVQDALSGLTESQRICIMLQSAGASYERMADITGFSRRKVERSVLEGRAALNQWEVRLASGAVCERLDPLLDKVSRGEASPGERRRVARHVRHCNPCRALLRSRRESTDWLAALVPVALVGAEALRAGPPDPSPLIAYWERLAGGATVRAGTAVQTLMEMPSTALAKVGAGTAAVVVAGAAGAPIVSDAVRPQAPEMRALAPVVMSAPATGAEALERRVTTPASPAAGTAGRTRDRRAAAPAAPKRTPRVVIRPRASAPARPPSDPPDPPAPRAAAPARVVVASVPEPTPVHTPAPAPAPAPVAPAPSTPPPAPGPDASAVALEFGP